MKKCLLLLVTLALLANLQAQVGSPDAGFGNNGIQVYTNTTTTPGYILKVLPASGNQYYTIYSTLTDFGDEAIYIAKYSFDGTLETSYGTDGFSAKLVMHFVDAALQDDGKLVVAGSTSGAYYGDFHDDELVARFTTAGLLDESFGSGGLFMQTYSAASYEFTRSLSIIHNQLVVMGYSMSLPGDIGFFHVNVINESGISTGSVGLAEVFDLQDFYPEYYDYSVAFQGDKLLVAASEPDLTGNGNFYSLRRYLANGTPDDGFGINGITTPGNDFFKGLPAVASQGDKILVSTYSFNPVTQNYGFAIGRYNNDGTFDNSFNSNGMQTIEFEGGDAVSPGAIVCSGDTIYIGGNKYNSTTKLTDFAIARLNKDGSPDTHFNGNGKQVTGATDYSLSLKKMAINNYRLEVSGTALSATKGWTAVKALYLLETPLVLSAPADTTVSTATGTCAAAINGLNPKINGADTSGNISYSLKGATMGAGTGSVSGVIFNKGETWVTYTAIADPAQKDSFRIRVLDKEIPAITNVNLSAQYLCPANHTMRPITIDYQAKDNCGQLSTHLMVTSNEQDKDNMDLSDLSGDWAITDANHLMLRAERSLKSEGRVYTIYIIAVDAAGNADTALATVVVPKSIKGQPDCDDDRLYAKAFPNPTQNHFTIQTRGGISQKLTLNVYDNFGRLMETRTNIPPGSSIQVGQHYNAGTYRAELIQGTKRFSLTMIKIRNSFLNF